MAQEDRLWSETELSFAPSSRQPCDLGQVILLSDSWFFIFKMGIMSPSS